MTNVATRPPDVFRQASHERQYRNPKEMPMLMGDTIATKTLRACITLPASIHHSYERLQG